MDQGIAHLLELAEGDTDAARWLADVLKEWASGRTWEQSCGFTGGGLGRYLRNRHLREAGRALDWNAAEMVEAVKRFEGRIWPAWRGRTEPPERAEIINAELFRARRIYPALLPVSRRQYERLFNLDINTRENATNDTA